ncbi:tannase/feruloyl esterase family alpha/beta hydrolase [Pararobbsia silviterrae]|uniref:Tannase/feruloyl esterase family alpha/beta hydrolase n=1 Tax=Pararobbsia silviterrae TaxID=1792498 RepID=A0A494Y4Q5_9BURK|nr:tannase/feruloyl esterase family alpha/beta hydrolase [Pararobbsia silviterrae]RKP57696.1 tannase/feruloyl esterase family alpha/beta hydrolase [Pararobbsia silviterrae]
MGRSDVKQWFARVRTRGAASWLAVVSACAATALIAACATTDNASHAAKTPLAVVPPVVDCSKLAAVDLTDIGGAGSSIASANVVASKMHNGATVNYCVVKGTLAPGNRFEIALPVSSWTQRFAELGCGGLCGNINDPTSQDSFSFSYTCPLVQEGGFVTAATDMGHTGDRAKDGGDWTTDAQRRADFAYRGQHVTTLAAKKLIKAYYGQAQKYAYFVGCSDGGREGLMAAQRYPTDYNGIVVGAPAAHFNIQNSLFHGWSVMSQSSTGDLSGVATLYADKVKVLHKAVVAACGGQSGVADGLVVDPRTCHFDPASIACPKGAANTSQCLTPAEVATARKLYGGPKDAATGEAMLAGSPQYGSEINWIGVEVPNSNSTAAPVPVASPGVFSFLIVSGAYKLIFPDSEAAVRDLGRFGYTDASFYAKSLSATHPLFDATSPDLSAFNKAGGKLILWHGWADQHISPKFTIQYYEALQSTMGASAVNDFARLYLVPGVDHCGTPASEGFNQIDLISQITAWVEQGTAPNAVMTYTDPTNSALKASRPVYPYPAVPQYTGTGDWHDGANWKQGAALYTEPTQQWAGASFYQPYAPIMEGVAAP